MPCTKSVAINLIRCCVFALGALMMTNTEAANAIEFNGRRISGDEITVVRQLETQYGAIPEGKYWYDKMTGAAGQWGGPTLAFLPAGLTLGDGLPANASGGGDGRVTGVFINGRELHPLDVQRLQQITPVYPGRYRWDSAGNVSYENGVYLFNFYALLQAKQQTRTDYKKGFWDPDRKTFVGKGCAHSTWKSSDKETTYDYYVGCE